MLTKETFQKRFFEYDLPQPYQNYYCKEYVKNNDLRLLVQIATKSHLRMFTDAKTGNLHFICKIKGQNCLDLQAYWHQENQGFFFDQDITNANHQSTGCTLQGPAFKYLEIYNLLKMKKDMIETFMVQNKMMEESPSTILNHISRSEEEYFFEAHINYQVELRRKLRKRFDNVVNIDIKKIGKSEEVEEVQKKKPKKTEKKEKSKEKAAKRILQKVQEKQMVIQQQLDDCSKDRAQNREFNREKEVMNDHRPSLISISQQKLTEQIADIVSNAVKIFEDFKTKTSKNKSIHKKSKKRPLKNTKNSKKTRDCGNLRESIFLLPQDSQSVGQEYFIDNKPPQSLAELNLLDQQAQYQWSSSESQPESCSNRPKEVLEFNQEDYFKSLRNSTLKKSLEKESLTSFLFSDPMGKENS